ncbi:MAG TPA: hypothetical protein VK826_02420 [Bacteroidia bacterium]|nr:hypothetical protein [Bacteroidia bacterium]
MILELALGFGAALLIGKAIGWKQDGDKLVVTTTARLHKLTFSKMTIIVKAAVKNPTKQGYKFKHPFVTLEYKKQPIGTSVVEDEGYQLKPYEQMMLKDIAVEVSMFSLPALAIDLFTILRTQTGAAPILVRTIVPVEIANQIVSVPYEQTINL